jgi:DNA-binding NarL/FixJ family response regulator
MAKQLRAKPRILFVDDEVGIRLTLPRVLAKFGFDITSVGSLDNALTEIRAEQFDILLSDLNLPEPNAGFAVIEAMRKAQPRCINFILTGYHADQSLLQANGNGVAHYFTKPVEIEEMVETMKNKLSRSGRDTNEMPVLNNLRILIVDDHEIVRRGLKALLESRAGWIVCGEAATGREAVPMAAEQLPDIVIMDIKMPGLNGLEATRQIRKILPETEIVVLSLHYSDQLVREIVEASARAYVLKSDAGRDLLAAVEALANKRTFFTSGAASSMVFANQRPQHKRPGCISCSLPENGRLCNF